MKRRFSLLHPKWISAVPLNIFFSFSRLKMHICRNVPTPSLLPQTLCLLHSRRANFQFPLLWERSFPEHSLRVTTRINRLLPLRKAGFIAPVPRNVMIKSRLAISNAFQRENRSQVPVTLSRFKLKGMGTNNGNTESNLTTKHFWHHNSGTQTRRRDSN